ncbi:MAG TPA: lysophospholipid acyltransferase family protein [Pseudonocardiaceae bacterium]|nr:lysophospholipid acyltransferase family protein [Pseudonocardiaceae bacterium]
MTSPHSWLPVSPCGPGCLPPADAVPTVTRPLRVLRLLAVAVLVLAGSPLVAAWPLLGPSRRERALRVWYRALLGVLRIRLQITGDDRFAAPAKGILVVSNHMSWLDLIALGAVQPLRMVAKSEVRGWPVVGPLARRTGTIFVDRKRLSALPGMIAAVAGALASGVAVGVFPEGTTWCGVTSGRFRPAVFQAAINTATAVRPVAVRYRLAGVGPTTVAAFVGPETFWETLVRVAGVHHLVIEVHLLPPLQPIPGTTRRTLAASAETAVRSA